MTNSCDENSSENLAVSWNIFVFLSIQCPRDLKSFRMHEYREEKKIYFIFVCFMDTANHKRVHNKRIIIALASSFNFEYNVFGIKNQFVARMRNAWRYKLIATLRLESIFPLLSLSMKQSRTARYIKMVGILSFIISTSAKWTSKGKTKMIFKNLPALNRARNHETNKYLLTFAIFIIDSRQLFVLLKYLNLIRYSLVKLDIFTIDAVMWVSVTHCNDYSLNTWEITKK